MAFFQNYKLKNKGCRTNKEIIYFVGIDVMGCMLGRGQYMGILMHSLTLQVTLVVNVASLCGYTESTYRALKKLHDILSKY